MPENYYHTLLGVEEEILQPDYYQLLLIDVDNDQLTPELVEDKYKIQMGKAQQVRTPKYKDLIEFLKGELRSAKRTLEKPELLKKYNQDRGKEVAEKVRDLIDVFIQISGDLSEIELHEIYHQAHILNCPKKMTEALIDEQLRLFHGKRVKASPEQMARASEIMSKRAAHNRLRSSDRLEIPGIAGASSASADVAEMREPDTQVRRMEEAADKLQRQAAARQRYGPALMALRIVNFLLIGVAWLAILTMLVWLIAPGALEGTVESQLGDGGLHLLYGKNPTADALRTDVANGQATIATRDNEIERLNGELAAAGSFANELLEKLAGGNPSRDQLASAHAQAKQLADRLRPAGADRTPMERLRELLGAGEPKAARELAETLAGDGTDENDVTLFTRDHVMPALLAGRSPWEWNLAQRPLDFRHTWFRPVDGGIEINVPADASEELVFPFGGPVEAGVLTLRGRWVGNPGSFGVNFWSGGTASGSVTVDPGGAGITVVVAGETRSAKLENVTADGAFTIQLSIAKQPGLKIEELTGKAKAEYSEPGWPRPTSATQSATTDATRAATGRIALRVSPGTKMVLETVTVQ